MRYDENWAVAPERAAAFFRAQADVREQDGAFLFGKCRIMLLPIEGRAMGKWKLARTQVIIEGDDADAREIHRRFLLRFLSAGG